MIFEYPEYLDRFHCTAGSCRDTCCAGWEVELDEESAQYYQEAEGAIGSRLRAAMRTDAEGSAVFALTAEGRCPFLNGENLCDLYEELGEDSLCRVCTDYPRYYREVGAYEQIDLSLSCEEAARLLLSSDRFRRKKLDTHEDEHEDPEAVQEREKLLRFRDDTIRMLQAEFNGADPDAGCRSPLDDLRRRIRKLAQESALPEEDDESLLAVLRELEVIDDRWIRLLEGLAQGEGIEGFRKNECAFEADGGVMLRSWFTKLAVYFVFRYTIDACEDGGIEYEIRILQRSLRCIFLLCVRRWEDDRAEGKTFSMEDLVDLVHLYSREVEHSAANTDRMKRP
jgi:lysine-N-methylase